MSIAFLGLTVKMCLKSKCDTIELGCLKIHRNTEQENGINESTDNFELPGLYPKPT